MAKSQRNPVSWNAHYNCLQARAPAAPIAERKRQVHAKNSVLRHGQVARNPVSWQRSLQLSVQPLILRMGQIL